MSNDDPLLLRAEIRFLEDANARLRDQLDHVGRLEEERQAELGQIEIDHRAALEQLRVAQVVSLGAIEENRQADLGAMAIAHREAMEAAEARHRAELDRVYAAHLFEIAAREGALAEARGDRDRAHDATAAYGADQAEESRRTLVALAIEHTDTLARERNAFEQMITALQEEITRLRARAAELEAELARERSVPAEGWSASPRERSVPAEGWSASPREASETPGPAFPTFEVTPRRSARPAAQRVYPSISDALRAAASDHDEGD